MLIQRLWCGNTISLRYVDPFVLVYFDSKPGCAVVAEDFFDVNFSTDSMLDVSVMPGIDPDRLPVSVDGSCNQIYRVLAAANAQRAAGIAIAFPSDILEKNVAGFGACH